MTSPGADPSGGEWPDVLLADAPCVCVRNAGARWYGCVRTDLHCQEYGADNEGHTWQPIPPEEGRRLWREATGRLPRWVRA